MQGRSKQANAGNCRGAEGEGGFSVTRSEDLNKLFVTVTATMTVGGGAFLHFEYAHKSSVTVP
jgi:hypothetical protein